MVYTTTIRFEVDLFTYLFRLNKAMFECLVIYILVKNQLYMEI